MIDMLSLPNAVFLAGLLHFCQVPGMLFATRMLGWREDLAKLEPINRRIVHTVGLGVMIAVLGLGAVVMSAPGAVAGGSRLGIALATFLAIFWAFRAAMQLFVYARIWPRQTVAWLSHL